MHPQERATDYRVVAAWSGFLLFIGAGAFAVGMALGRQDTAGRASKSRPRFEERDQPAS